MSNRTILITGATGFIGRHVIADFAEWDIVAAVRGRATRPFSGVRTVPIASIGSRTRWDEALVGVDTVLHLAGVAHRAEQYQNENAALYEEVNVSGTLVLAEAAARYGVRDFIFASSIAVHGPRTEADEPPFTESAPIRPVGIYGTSKARAEEGLADIAARTGMACTAFRPPVVYGRDAPGNIGRLEAAIRRGLPLPLASVRNRRAVLGVANLTSFLAWRLGGDNYDFEAFIVADDEHPSTPEFVTLLGQTLGRPARLFPFPPDMLRTLLVTARRPTMADALLSSLEVDTSKIRAEGWYPPFALADSVPASYAPGAW